VSFYDRIVEGGGYDDPPDLSEFQRQVLRAARATPSVSGTGRFIGGKAAGSVIKTMRKQGVTVKAAEGKKKVEKALAQLHKRGLVWTRREGTWSGKAGGEVFHTRVSTPSATSIKRGGYVDLLLKKLKKAGIKTATTCQLDYSKTLNRREGIGMSIADVVKLAALPSFKLPTKDEARAHRHAKGK